MTTKVQSCPCHSEKPFSDCCKPYIEGSKLPQTPEALMRSRYTAYTLANIDYIKQTMRGNAAEKFNEKDVRTRTNALTWLGLDVISASSNNVEFIARFKQDDTEQSFRESSEFEFDNGRWYYIDGELNKIS